MYNSYPGGAADSAVSGAATAGMLAFFGVYSLVMLAVLVLVIAGLWKIFVKAGQPGWAAIVPIYNIYILLQIVGRPTWWLALLLLAFIPVIGSLAVLVVLFILYWDLAKSFGKDVGFAIGMVLLSFVFVPMLGFGSAQYLGPKASGFGLPDTPAGGPGMPGGYAGGGYTPPAGGYAPPPPGGGYTPPAPPAYTPPAPPAYTPPAPPTYAPPTPPAAPAPPAAPTYEPPAAPPAPPTQVPPA